MADQTQTPPDPDQVDDRPASQPDPPPFSMRAIGLPVYAPALLYGVGQGAIAGVIALSAHDKGASVAGAGTVVALVGIGGLIGDLPAGALAARFGERRAMLAAAVLMAAGLIGCVLAPNVWLLGIAVLAVGVAGATWMLARQAYIAESVPYAHRARALSLLGGVNRIGMFVGPFLGTAALSLLGLNGPYLLFVAVVAFAVLVLLTLPDPPGADGPGPPGAAGTPTRVGRVGPPRGSLRAVFEVGRDSLPVLRTLGIGVVVVGAVRACRQAVIPLWGLHLGLAPTTITLIFGVSGAIDMLLFYPAGLVMDRYGRAAVAVPSMTLLGLSFVLLPFAHGAVTVGLVAGLMGAGNGMGSGLIMTLGADQSPPGRRAEFLGAWRLCGDTGTSLGPLALSGLVPLVTLGPAVAVMGGVGIAGAWYLGHWIRRTPARQHAVHLPGIAESTGIADSPGIAESTEGEPAAGR